MAGAGDGRELGHALRQAEDDRLQDGQEGGPFGWKVRAMLAPPAARHAPNGRGAMAFLSRRRARGSRSGAGRTSSRVGEPRGRVAVDEQHQRRPGVAGRRAADPAVRRRRRSGCARPRGRSRRAPCAAGRRRTSRTPRPGRRPGACPAAGRRRRSRRGARRARAPRRARPRSRPACDRVMISPAATSDSSTRPTIDAASPIAPGGANSDGTDDAASSIVGEHRSARAGRSRPSRRPPALPRPGAAPRPGPGSRAPPRTRARRSRTASADEDLRRERPAATEHVGERSHGPSRHRP